MVIVPSSIISYFYSKEMSPKIVQDKKVVEIDFETIEIIIKKKPAKIDNS